MKKAVVIAALAPILALGLTACSSSSSSAGGSPAPSAEVASPSSSAPSATASAVPSAPAAGGATIDAAGLVAAMWGQLDSSSQKQMCDIYASQGDKAGLVFVAGTESDPQANLLTDADKAAIAMEGASILKAKC